MRIPGRLKDTTLGDVLGTLWRQRATGFLELIDRAGRPHRIELCDGAIQQVHSVEGPRLGEILDLDGSRPDDTEREERVGQRLLEQGLVNREQLSDALRLQNLRRLEFLFSLSDAAVRFRVPRPKEHDPTAPAPLGASEFLVGRPRHRAREASRRERRHQVAPIVARRREALQVLGLREDATEEQVRAAFRKLAGQFHPDRHGAATAEERARLFRKFAEISSAFHSLCA